MLLFPQVVAVLQVTEELVESAEQTLLAVRVLLLVRVVLAVLRLLAVLQGKVQELSKTHPTQQVMSQQLLALHKWEV